MHNVIAYGTLMFPEVGRRVAGLEDDGQPVTVNGFRRYEATTGARGNYPAIVPDRQSSFDGILYRDVSDQQLKQLDDFEDVAGGLYVRQVVEINWDGQLLSAFIYVCGPSLKQRLRKPLSRAWNPELFRRHELSRYVAQLFDPVDERPNE